MAVSDTLPSAIANRRALLSMRAKAVSESRQAAWSVRSCSAPSENVPITKSCWEAPAPASVRFAGSTRMETSFAGDFDVAPATAVTIAMTAMIETSRNLMASPRARTGWRPSLQKLPQP